MQNSIQGSTEAGLVIGLLSCTNNPEGCPGPDVEVGTILYNKKLNPTIHPGEEDGPYENFTFTVPNDFPAGAAQLSTNRLHLIGVRMCPSSHCHKSDLLLSQFFRQGLHLFSSPIASY